MPSDRRDGFECASRPDYNLYQRAGAERRIEKHVAHYASSDIQPDCFKRSANRPKNNREYRRHYALLFRTPCFFRKTSLYVLIELPVGQTIDADTIGLALSAACAEHRESEKDVIIFSGGVSICPSPTTAKMTLGKVKHFNYQLQFAAQKGLRLICPSGPETKPSDFQRYVPICDSEDLFRGTTYMMPPVAFLIHTFAEAILIRSRMAGMSTEPSLAPKAEMSAAPTPPITLVLMPSMQSQPSHGILPFPIEYGYTPLTYTYYYTVSVKPSA